MKSKVCVASGVVSSRIVGLMLAAACLGIVIAPAQALIITDAGQQNFRFEDHTSTGAVNPTFIGKDYDLSGVAVSANDSAGNFHPAGAMMISPHYYVTATHYGSQASLSFRSRDGRTITKAVAGGRAMAYGGGTSDLYIGKLAGDGITAADQVSFYPVVVEPANDWAWYTGQNIFVYSMNGGNSAGINTIRFVRDDGPRDLVGKSINFRYYSPTPDNPFDYEKGLAYPNQAGVNGESGSPWGLIWNGQFTAGGARSAYYGTGSPNQSYDSVSSFLPYYMDQVNAYMHESHPNENVTVQPIPEPAGLAALALGGTWLMRRRR